MFNREICFIHHVHWEVSYMFIIYFAVFIILWRKTYENSSGEVRSVVDNYFSPRAVNCRRISLILRDREKTVNEMKGHIFYREQEHIFTEF